MHQAYGRCLLSSLAEYLRVDFGQGEDASTFRCMRVFYQVFPIRDALRRGFGWAHARMPTKLGLGDARHWNMNEADAETRIADDLLNGTMHTDRPGSSVSRSVVLAA